MDLLRGMNLDIVVVDEVGTNIIVGAHLFVNATAGSSSEKGKKIKASDFEKDVTISENLTRSTSIDSRTSRPYQL